jgi:hypothetical protein
VGGCDESIELAEGWRHLSIFASRLPIIALLRALPLIFLAVFYLYPLLAILRVSFAAPAAAAFGT